MPHAVSDEALDTLFRTGRTLRHWQDRPVSPALLMALYELMRWGPTEANITPARIVFVTSPAAKARLEPLLDEGNRRQTMAAPATAIIGYDLDFARHLPVLAPRSAAAIQAQVEKNPAHAYLMALRSTGLEGGYFILAVRALGLDAGPMSGFDAEGVDREFFSGTRVKSLFLCNLGYGDASHLHPRAARLSFDHACRFL
jgi:3-hydroxypropanoate dehydrogenase